MAIFAMLCATPALQLKTWDSLQTKTATAATGYTLRNGMVPSSAPQATIQLVPHGDVNPETVVFYRDTNAWCPFCERVYLYLLEADSASGPSTPSSPPSCSRGARSSRA